MPVAAQVGLEFGDDDNVAFAGLYPPLASRAHVTLARRIRLDRGDDLYPETDAHTTRPATMRSVPTTMAMSTADLR